MFDINLQRVCMIFKYIYILNKREYRLCDKQESERGLEFLAAKAFRQTSQQIRVYRLRRGKPRRGSTRDCMEKKSVFGSR